MTVPAGDTFQRAVLAIQKGELDGAEHLLKQTIAAQPEHIPALNVLSSIVATRGRRQEAQQYLSSALAAYDKALQRSPGLAEAWLGRGQLLSQIGRHVEAVDSFDRAIACNPQLAHAHLLRAKLLADLGRLDQSLHGVDRLLELAPNLAHAWIGRGNVLFELKRHAEALDAYDRACALDAALSEAWLGRGNILNQLKRYKESLAAYDRALVLNNHLPGALLGRGNTLAAIGRHDEALLAYDRAVSAASDFAEAWLNRGNLLISVNRHEEALTMFERALALQPSLAEAWLGVGNALCLLKRYKNALAAYDKALTIRSDLAAAQFGRGSVFAALKRHRDAAEAYATVLSIDPQHPFAEGLALHQKTFACDWSGIDALIKRIEDEIVAGKLSAEPFILQSVTKSVRTLQLCSELYNREKYPAGNVKPFHSQVSTVREKIHIGYLSGEFREQATAHLIVGVLEHHDRSRFGIYCFDNGWDDGSEIRQRINAAVPEIIDIRKLGDEAALATIRKAGIDVLVNLNGYFGEQRTQLFAQRGAPIQVSYLGFPGTLGASYIDYIVADRDVIPEHHKQFYTEKIVYLPSCYQANDNKKEIAPNVPSRIDCGLPETGFVFCCFNSSYKILPEIFDRWMKILSQVSDSFLWLLSDNPETITNLRREAASRNVNPDRLIFARPLAMVDHLARQALADLFLDTLPCNAHTTASDALWAGLPILTCTGETFSGRVATSLLNSIGLSELVTTTLEDYERRAVDMALNRQKWAMLNERLYKSRFTAPLFNTELFTRHLETGYGAIFDRYRVGLSPDHIYIAG
jgi:predicted O-linked N-acetylglucosamine transferase (SPINDLY family)